MKPKFPIPVTPFDPLTLDAFEIEAHILKFIETGGKKMRKQLKTLCRKFNSNRTNTQEKLHTEHEKWKPH